MGSQTLTVRLSDQDMALAQDIINYHHKLGEIPKNTVADYLRFLFVRDVEDVMAAIEERRSRMQG